MVEDASWHLGEATAGLTHSGAHPSHQVTGEALEVDRLADVVAGLVRYRVPVVGVNDSALNLRFGAKFLILSSSKRILA